jgi:hypothetical protein
MSNEKRSYRYVSSRTIYADIPLYSSIPCALPRVCRRNLWVRILLSPSYSFFSSFSFSFFSFFFYFSLYSIPTTIDGAFLSFYQNIFTWDLVWSCFEGFIKKIQWCNQILIWFFDFWVTPSVKKKNDVLWFKVCQKMTFYLIWHVCMCM